jgi:uncharacterized phiE125 gp8 family phage protein
MTMVVLTPPTLEPVTLAELKSHLRLDPGDPREDADLMVWLAAARAEAEVLTGRSLAPQTIDMAWDRFPAFNRPIELLRPPLASVTSVTYVDPAGTIQTLAPGADYTVDTGSEPGRVVCAYGKTWPAVRAIPHAVRVRYLAGYIESPEGSGLVAAPAGVKAWIRIRAADLYENRESMVIGTIIAKTPGPFVDGLLDPYRVVHL